MEQMGRFRHELKYKISREEYFSLRSRIRWVMKPDVHIRDDGTYVIRSIYFDNIYDKALREKINGILYREKFRIRYYNDDFSYIMLEKKTKHDRLCMKQEAELTKEECMRLCSGDTVWMRNHQSPLVKELYIKMKTGLLKPRVMVSYIREPYIYPAGNVRVTFDSDIRTSLYWQRFFEPGRHDVCAGDMPEDMILEVKYDDFLPDVISHLIQMGGIRQQAFSKYGICRRFG